jgi:hypothetical protein
VKSWPPPLLLASLLLGWVRGEWRGRRARRSRWTPWTRSARATSTMRSIHEKHPVVSWVKNNRDITRLLSIEAHIWHPSTSSIPQHLKGKNKRNGPKKTQVSHNTSGKKIIEISHYFVHRGWHRGPIRAQRPSTLTKRAVEQNRKFQ